MLVFDGFGGLLVLGLWIFSFIDVLLTPETECRSLPKLAWIFLVLLVPLLGSVAWLVAGRRWNRAGSASQRPSAGLTGRPGRPTNPDDDEEFLAGLRLRAEEQRRRAREQEERDTREGETG